MCLAGIFRALWGCFTPKLHFCFSSVGKCSPLHVLTCRDVVKCSFLPVACVTDKATFQCIQKEPHEDRQGQHGNFQRFYSLQVFRDRKVGLDFCSLYNAHKRAFTTLQPLTVFIHTYSWGWCLHIAVKDKGVHYEIIQRVVANVHIGDVLG